MDANGVELLAPAGDFETALAAFEAGADAVYCGLSDFSARAFARNFSPEDLRNLVRYVRAPRPSDSRRRRVYVTFNTVVDEDSFASAVETLARLEEIGPDALIVQDIGVARICRKFFTGLELHASTQLVAHNLEGVLALGDLGFRRIVLARELSLDEISSIAKRCGGLELECFIHGALCYSISGLCLFGAMEKGRSGNRGRCPYCCRQGFGGGSVRHPFSMKDLRLGEDARKLADAGVASLKIEGRMKSPLYVASVTKYYRQILDARQEDGVRASGASRVSVSDLETVFSRRTTELYFNGRPTPSDARTSPIDPSSLGHTGTPVGVVKKVTKDREGKCWLRFHTCRGLEKHDGLQFEAMTEEDRHFGMGIVEMRQAISRRPVFEVNAGVDVEVLLPAVSSDAATQRRVGETDGVDLARILKPGMKIYCSMSNAVKRMFPAPSFRPSDYPGGTEIDVAVTLENCGIAASARVSGRQGVSECESPLFCEATIACTLQPAKNPERTEDVVTKAFQRLGGTDYRLARVTLNDPDRLFAPMSILNDLRRELVERLDEARERARRSKIESALGWSVGNVVQGDAKPLKTVKIRAGQRIPPGEWDETVVAINADTDPSVLPPATSVSNSAQGSNVRLALPVYTAEPDFGRLRNAVKRLLREGYDKWEASDLATLRMLKLLGVTDTTADWTLYAFNARALEALSDAGVKRFVASPENTRENLRFLAESGYGIDFLIQQSTPLFISLTEPAAKTEELAVCRRDGLWVTTKPVPRTFAVAPGLSTRLDLSWDG